MGTIFSYMTKFLTNPKNWPFIGAFLVIAAITFFSLKYVFSLHGDIRDLNKVRVEHERTISNLNVEVLSYKAKINSLRVIFDSQEKDLIDSRSENSRLEDIISDSRKRIGELEKVKYVSRETTEILYGQDDAKSKSEIDRLNRLVNCKFKSIVGEECV